MMRRIALALAMTASGAPAFAACPIELAVYGDAQSGAAIDFRPNGEAAAVTNAFRLLLDSDLALDGIVMWTEEPARPTGLLMHKCPEGDVTGEELQQCTLWQGVIYAADAAGKVGLLPAEGAPAPQNLILADLGAALRHSAVYGTAFSKAPFDVFALQGCQE